MGKSLKAASPAVAYILLIPLKMESAHIYTCRCELIFILYATGIAEPSDKGCRGGSHSMYLSVYGEGKVCIFITLDVDT